MIWTLIAAALAGTWLFIAVRCTLAARSMPMLAEGPPPPLDTLPSLTVVLAARDEELTIRRCLESLLAQDYPGLKIVCVDDRSTDATGRIADELETIHPGRLHVIHIVELPAGWLGKCHALWRGTQGVDSEHILFTDADVFFEPTALSRAAAHAHREQADLLCAFPEMIMPTLWERVFTLGFAIVYLSGASPHAAQRERSRLYMGIGAFNLVRRELHERAGGHRALRLEVLDDLMLGRQIKRLGGRLRAAYGHGLFSIRWQSSVMGHIRGLEKNVFASFDYRAIYAIWIVALLLTANVGPLICLAFGSFPARVISLVTWLGLMPWIAAQGGRGVRLAALHGPLMPLGGALMGAAIFNSMWRTLRQGGIRWRDTFHPLSELRAFRQGEKSSPSSQNRA
jgi:glycosyltransferase involved in cell wall biosynthesis